MVMGAHAAPSVRAPTHLRTITSSSSLVFILALLEILLFVESSPESDAQSLLKFKSSLANADEVLSNWRPSTNPCGPPAWNGVLCSVDGSGGNYNVWGLQLENLGLSGHIDVDSLVGLPLLRTLSFMNNEFEGPLPDFRKLGALKSLYLSDNQFSGPIPNDAFEGMASLKKLHMANNQFTGNIPTSMAASPRIFELKLDNNQFEGRIPDFRPGLKLFNVSNNQLQGPIPPTLKNINPSSFLGNTDLCGPPLDFVCNPLVSPPPAADADVPKTSANNNNDSSNKSSSSGPSPQRVVVIVIACLVVLAAIVVLYMMYHRRQSSHHNTPHLGQTMMSSSKSTKYKLGEATSTGAAAGSTVLDTTGVVASVAPIQQRKGEQQHGKLSFVREDRQRFELQDLLRASAEVLGSGSFGSSYKAVLMDGQAVVVKRFKQMSNVGREEFHEHMRRLGRLNHPNLLPLVAYYYRKEEKLLVFDYVHHGSLASQLHGKHTPDKLGLDWPTRLKIIKGVARGLCYLYNELPSLIVPHGHLKSSNVLLDKSYDPLLMDYTLVPVVNLEQAHQLLVAYKSPEHAQQGRTTKKTDVWSLGILILEMLTGQFPANCLLTHQSATTAEQHGGDLAMWVNSIVATTDDKVFDEEMGSTNNAQREMMKLLKIGVDCCQEDLETRPDLKEAADKIELLKERDEDAQVVDV